MKRCTTFWVIAVVLALVAMTLPGVAVADCQVSIEEGCIKCFAQQCHDGFLFGHCSCEQITGGCIAYGTCIVYT